MSYVKELRVGPKADMVAKAQERLSRQKRKQIEEFQRHHGLSDMHKMLQVIVHCRKTRDWSSMSMAVWLFIGGYGNLTEPEREHFKDALPSAPSHSYSQGSDGAWMVYLASLLAVPTRRITLKNAIEDRIKAQWGPEYVIEDFDPAHWLGEPDIPTF